MAEQGYQFTEASAKRIGKVVRLVEDAPSGTDPSREPYWWRRRDLIFGKLTGACTARSSNTLGTGTLTIYAISTDWTVTATTDTETVGNWVPSTVGSSTTFAIAHRDYLSGRFLINGAECV